ncbi:glycosyltransferase family 4 protein [Propionispora vibrioides]|uniref:Glycosyltransferase involved in cell wall bisynthesis n=1 Tax=Propionispora vibrioides TaxID=112903 RepID=A0A1H8S0U5_9FIRM|nr:glycosyltransferase family 4 protein [Propionispora vibrioides]SEO72290.1 Glycosyltransferase involved in cell wall bisynthesis [Propionispora vibrioides]
MQGLYLRTVFWFNLAAGGSVGHTAGVINSLRKYIELHVISNDNLIGVKEDIQIIRPSSSLSNFFPLHIRELLYNFKLILNLKEIKSDFIYQRYSGGSFIGAYLAKKYHIPFVLEFNSSDVWKIKNWNVQPKSFLFSIVKYLYKKIIQLPLVKFVEHYNLKYADIIVVVSEVLKEDLILSGVNSSKILVNPNGVDIKHFSSNKQGMEIKEKYGLGSKIVVGFIGTFGQWHGVLELARAISYFYKHNRHLQEKVKFLLVGDGVLLAKTKSIIAKDSLADKVIFTGLVPQQEAVSYLDACDILVSPHIQNPDGTKFFGSPTKLFEYMAMAKGIVASDLEQIGEILSHNETGYLTEPGNIIQIAEGIKVLVEDEALRNKMGLKAREYVSRYYTWEQHVLRILNELKYNYNS